MLRRPPSFRSRPHRHPCIAPIPRTDQRGGGPQSECTEPSNAATKAGTPRRNPISRQQLDRLSLATVPGPRDEPVVTVLPGWAFHLVGRNHISDTFRLICKLP